jgi:hypothetical protein
LQPYKKRVLIFKTDFAAKNAGRTETNENRVSQKVMVEEKPGKKRAKTWLKEHFIMNEAQLQSGPLMNAVAYRS